MTRLIAALASLKLTLIGLTGLLIVVFVSTLAQVNLGIFLAKKVFFEGLFIYWTPMPGITIPVFLTGYAFGVILVINLIAAHLKRLKLSIKKLGIWLIHSGLIVLIVGSGVVATYTIESQLALEEGETKSYTQSLRSVELAILTDGKTAGTDTVIAIPLDYLKKYRSVQHEALPFELNVSALFKNSQLTRLEPGSVAPVTQGIGAQLKLTPLKPRYDDNYRNMISMTVEVQHEGGSLGTWLLSTGLGAEQPVLIDGKRYRMMLRPTRYYLGFDVTLNDFQHDKYPGTEIPKDFASEVSVRDHATGVVENARIYMNHPLRFGGYTFYQASYGKADTMSVLQVVNNPGWLLPYLASIIMTAGLTIHFGIMLWQFLAKARRKRGQTT